jgi:Tfp pilus assembly protein PilF
MRKGDPESLSQARAAFLLADELLECDPRTKDALGAVAWREGDLDHAREMFAAAIACDPEYSPAYMHLATIAEKEGQSVVAERLMEKSLAIAPTNGRARNNMSALYWAQGAEGSARVELRKAFEVMGSKESVLKFNAQQVNRLERR